MKQQDISLVEIARSYDSKTAIIDDRGEHTYLDLRTAAEKVASSLLEQKPDLEEERIPFLAPPGFEYVVLQWGIWMAGGIAVPLCYDHSIEEIRYVLSDCQAKKLLYAASYIDKIRVLEDSFRLIGLGDLKAAISSELPCIKGNRRAMIIYTSGSTAKPKGVVSTHDNIKTQISCLVNAWEWRSSDYILSVLPLHHIHGIINVVGCALWSGASIRFLKKFKASVVWECWMKEPFTLFMGVPTIYHRLIDEFQKADPKLQKQMRSSVKSMRLMVSGSAALPEIILEKWKKISEHTLLERYGMTEIGMAISNPYKGKRKASRVGFPLDGVKVRIVDENGRKASSGEIGEIWVQGDGVFKEYWNNPTSTKESFNDRWFKTGDMARVDEDNYFQIIGRKSVDIIKSGGYKISALEIEEALRTIVEIKDCAVVGISDEALGKKIVACLTINKPENLNPELLKTKLKEKLAPYKLPREFHIYKELPRNKMGKVIKPDLIKQLERD